MPSTRIGSFLGRTQKYKKAAGGRAGRGKCGAIKRSSSIVTQGDMWWMRSGLWWLKGADQACWALFRVLLLFAKRPLHPVIKDYDPRFYGVHTQRGMSSHSCCLDGAATGHGLISSFCPPFALRVSELGWQVTSVQLQDLQRTSASIEFFLKKKKSNDFIWNSFYFSCIS